MSGNASAGGRPAILLAGVYPDAVLRHMENRFELHRLGRQPDLAALDLDPETAGHIRGFATDAFTGAPGDFLARLPALEIVGNFGVGVDKVDFAACRARGIKVSNTPGVLTEDVADFGVALMLAASRRIASGDRFVRDGGWTTLIPDVKLGRSLRGKRLGIVGLGAIGRAIAQSAEAAFGMRVAYAGPRRKDDVAYEYHPSAEALARDSDVLMVVCKGGPETRHLIDAAVLAALGPEGTLVNISRGTVVDQAALIAALEAGRLGAAALDVFQDEPDVPAALTAMENVVLMPHQGSATEETRHAMGMLVADNLEAHFAGRPLPTPVA